MRLLTLLIVLAPAIVLAETVAITVSAPTQQVTVQNQTTTVTPETVTVNAVINSVGTDVVTVSIPGQQGPPGTGGGGVTVHNNLTGRDAASVHPASSITGLAPIATSGSYNDLSNKPTIPSAANQIAYATGTVQSALDTLLYVAPSSPSVTGGGSYEIGQTISSVALVWSITLGTKSLTSQSINNGIGALDVADRSYTHSGQSITSNRTYTVSITDGTTPRTGSTTVAFYYKRFWGVSSSATLDDAGIRALSQEYSTTRVQSRSMTASAQYLYFCWPDDWGAPTWTVNGLANTDFTLVRNDTFTNASGYSYTIRLYRSGNMLTGTYTVGVL